VQTNEVQYGIWYLEKHKIWITTGAGSELPNTKKKDVKGHFINDWNYRPQNWNISLYSSFRAHKDHIMDVTEITSKAAIATCSLDHKIKLWDLSTGHKLGSLKPHHITGVRTLNYTPDFGSLLISTAHENAMKVWLPEVSIQKAYAGTLEGHNTLIVSARFIKNSPYLVSVDDRINLRVWDVRSLLCIQSVSQPYKRSTCNGLCVLSELQRIVVYGKTLLAFDATTEKTRGKEMEVVDDAYPIKAEFNEYNNSFIVVTKADVRVYDGENGKLAKVFTGFGKNQLVEITFCCINERRFYVGCSDGSIRLYNINGLLIKQVVEETTYQREGSRRSDYKLNTRSISGLKFVQKDEILLASSFDSTVSVYDEANPETTFRLRKLEGGHLNAPITCMNYSEHLSLIATGSMNGEITVWDYEMSRVEGVCLGHTREILTLNFLDPCPLLLSTSTDGIIYLWGVRSLQYVCLATLLNIHVKDFGFPSLCVTSALVLRGDKIPKQKNEYSKMKEEELKDIYLKSIGNSNKKRFIDPKKVLNSAKRDERMYVIMGDEKGRIRILDLRYVIKVLSIEPAKRHRDDDSFNAKRKENCNVSFIVTSELSK